MAARLSCVSAPTTPAQMREHLAAALAELGHANSDALSTDPTVFPCIEVTDLALFKSSFPLYPSGLALGLLAWRRTKSAEAGAAKL